MTRPRRCRRIVFGVLLAASGGCASLQAFTGSHGTSAEAWSRALATAESDANVSEFAAADSVLAAFAVDHPGTPEALETAYWRAIFKMDPTNPDLSLPTAMASLDGYLSDPRAQQHVVEAKSLRRMAGQLAGLTRVAVGAIAEAKDATATASSAKAEASNAKSEAANARAEAAKAAPDTDSDAEIKRLKSELAKANAELDRIRRRLAQPTPGKPPAV
jgi:Sec-independent protein translocase protein TatA